MIIFWYINNILLKLLKIILYNGTFMVDFPIHPKFKNILINSYKILKIDKDFIIYFDDVVMDWLLNSIDAK